LNQLLAHHGIVFKPNELKVWVSTNPYQLGAFVAYDLNEVFANREGNPASTSLSEKKLTIAKDPFILTQEYKDYEAYRSLESVVEVALENNNKVSSEQLSQLQTLNPTYWKAHYLAGKYYLQNNYDLAAMNAFEKAVVLEITTTPDREMVEKELKKLRRKFKK
jgi:hypothetical protein